jgi:hypothetical protein
MAWERCWIDEHGVERGERRAIEKPLTIDGSVIQEPIHGEVPLVHGWDHSASFREPASVKKRSGAAEAPLLRLP